MQYGLINGKFGGIRSHGHEDFYYTGAATEIREGPGIRLDWFKGTKLHTWLRSGTETIRSSGNRPATGGRRMVRKRALQKGQRDSTRPQAMMQTKQKKWAQQSSSPRMARRPST
jgi:hypothetical protein